MRRRTSSGRAARHAGPISEAPAHRQAARLCPDHPLSRAIAAVGYTSRQCTDVGAVLVGSVIAHLQGARWSAPLAGSAATVLAVLSLLLAFRVLDRHDCVIDLILDGNEDAELPVVQRERDRLLSVRKRSKLAGSLADMVREAQRPPRRSRFIATPLVACRIVAPLADELLEISGLLRAGPMFARGVARLDRLLGHATSPLYGDDVDALRNELHQVRELLVKRRP